ncbi:MAG TPA: hypothetical protein VMU48_12265 [Terracidiphilus sp.]|nr:hypothetical protein [Terracidiphilus sp.]
MIQELIERATASGVRLTVEAGTLRAGPADKLVPFVAELKRYRSDVIAYLTRPKVDPDEWAEPFTAWLNAHCVADKRISSNLVALYRDFSARCQQTSDWPCSLDGFESLLRQVGFTLIRVHGEMMVERLGLIEDMEAARAA